MKPLADVVFLLDVDNTLLDNDQVVADLRAHLLREFGESCAGRYWTIFEELRTTLGYADYLGALQRYRTEVSFDSGAAPRSGAEGTSQGASHGADAQGADSRGPDTRGADSRAADLRLLQMSGFLVDYPFAARLYPRVPEVIQRLSAWGPTVILSDGDVVFQPRKVQRSGLWDAVAGRVLIYVHKEQMLDAVQRQYPARHYVMVDDKLRILAAMKRVMGQRLTTVFPRQGHYALDPEHTAPFPAADVSVERIGELAEYDLDALRPQP